MSLTVVASRPIGDDLGSGSVPAPASDIPGLIDQAADRYGVPRTFARAIANVESNLKPNAVSPKGAAGVMQLMPATARGLGVTDIKDPAQNIDAGVRYLAQLSDKYGGDLRLTAAAYNAGPGAVDKYGDVPPYPETQKYVKKLQPTIAQLTAPQPAAGQPTAAQTAAGIDDILARLGRGENVDITPERIMQVAFGRDQGAPTAPAPAPLRVVASRPIPAPAPPAPPQSITDQLKNEGFLDSAWNMIKGQFSTVLGAFTGKWSQQQAEQLKQYQQIQQNGTPEQKREFAKQVILGNIPFASTLYKLGVGNIPGFAGDVVGMGAIPGALEVARSPATGAFTKAFTQTIQEAPPSPTGKVLGGVAGLALGRQVEGVGGAALGGYLGKEIGAKLPAVPGAVRAGLRAARTALAEPAAVPTPAPVIPPQARLTAGDTIAEPLQLPRGPLITPYEQPEPIPPSRQLEPGPAVIRQMPPAADASYVRAVPAEYAQTEPGFQAQPEAPAAPAVDAKFLDALARSQVGKSFARATADEQTAIRHLAARLNQPPAETPPPPPQPSARVDIGQAIPGKTISEELDAELAARQASAAPVAEPAPPEVAKMPPSEAKAAVENVQRVRRAKKAAKPAEPPVSAAEPATSPQAAPTPATAVAEDLPIVARNPEALRAAQQLRDLLEEENPASQADKLTQHLVINKIPGSMIDQFQPEQWKMVADHAGLEMPSAETQAEVRARIAEWEKPARLATEKARATKVDTLTQHLIDNKVPGSMIDQFRPQEWKLVADHAGVPMPSAKTQAAVRAKIAEYESAANLSPEVNKMPPAQAKAAVEQAQRVRRAKKPPKRAE